MPELKWRLTASWPKSLDTLYGAPEYMAKRIAELSENKFQIQVFAAGEIVPGLQVLDAVQNGTVEMGHTRPTISARSVLHLRNGLSGSTRASRRPGSFRAAAWNFAQ